MLHKPIILIGGPESGKGLFCQMASALAKAPAVINGRQKMHDYFPLANQVTPDTDLILFDDPLQINFDALLSRISGRMMRIEQQGKPAQAIQTPSVIIEVSWKLRITSRMRSRYNYIFCSKESSAFHFHQLISDADFNNCPLTELFKS